MPDGSQSWKIIKTSAHSSGRIAQACDRCRSKKIKCDGKLPQCTQCIAVGFECKTSDKLSRRAFPRGYTETLEQRVRVLEKELRECQESKSKSSGATTPPSPSPQKSVHVNTSLKARLPNENEDGIVVDEVYRLLSRTESMNGSFLGSSNGRSFFELFRKRLSVSKNVSIDFDEVLPFYKQTDNSEEDHELTDTNTTFALPSKSSAEKLVQEFFNNWHPLFPVLHRPSFQWDFDAMYTEKASKDPAHLAQMWLVLAIAARDAVAKGGEAPEDHRKFFLRAKYFLRQIQSKHSVGVLKALILATLYLFAEENYDLLWQYKTLAVGSAYKLGLHRCQKKMKLGPLTTEMRKRVFWSLYVVDSFSSAIVGLPQLLDDRQINTEFPADLDDDFVTEMGFLPTPPGNFSVMSAAIALFRASKILSCLLHDVYSPQRVSLDTIVSLEKELDDWRNGLPGYLRVDLENCIPTSTSVHSHAPMLLFTYHWMRTLIHRPVLASTCLRKEEISKSSAALGESSLSICGILSSLQENKLPISLCLSSDFLLWTSCISIMEISLVQEKASRVNEVGSQSIESAMRLLRQQSSIHQRTLFDKRIVLLEQCLKAIPTSHSKLDCRDMFPSSNMSPPVTLRQSWPPTLSTGAPSNPTFDFNFMRTGRLSESSVTESVASLASSFDPSSVWTPTNITDGFSTSPEETSKNDILEAFLSTILDENSEDTNSLFNLPGDSPTQPGLIIPSNFNWNNPTFSDEDGDTKVGSPVSPSTYLPIFLGDFSSSESSPDKTSFDVFKGDTFNFKDSGFPNHDGNSHIHTAPNLFSEESGWAV